MEEIKNESNIVYVLQKLADSEEQLGKIYKSIAVHYKKNAEKYQMLSSAIDKIGDEEFGHRDVILNDMKNRSQGPLDQALIKACHLKIIKERKVRSSNLNQIWMI